MTLDEFQIELAAIIGMPSDHRPFVCDGNPLTCEIMIVGSNAATKPKSGFWKYWRPQYGFEKRKWLSDYVNERRNTGEHFEISPTRRRIEWICDSAKPTRCLETNRFSIASKRTSDLTMKDKGTEVIALLAKHSKPIVIFAHGKEAKTYFEGLSRRKLNDGHPETCEVSGQKSILITGSHLFNWSETKSRQLGRYLHALSTKSDRLIHLT